MIKVKNIKSAGPLFIAQRKTKDIYYIDDFIEKRNKPMEMIPAKCEPASLKWENMGQKKKRGALAIVAVIVMIALTVMWFFAF